MDVKEILTRGLALASTQHTADTLGDRSTYVGASDASGCPRKAILGKRFPEGTRTLAAMIRMKRGHLAEEILVEGYRQAGIIFRHQDELVPDDFPAPCKIHPDIIVEEGECLEVQEIKTTEGIPSSPYDSWQRQLNLQMGALRKENPDRLVKGKVIAMDLNTGQVKDFPQEFDPRLFEFIKSRVDLIWKSVQEETPDPLPTEKGPLCGWCGFAGTCPALARPDGLLDLPIEEDLQQILELRELTNSSDKQLKKLTHLVHGILEEQGVSAATAGNLMVKRCRRSKNGSIDIDLLKREQEGIYEAYRKPATEYYVLEIQ